ncbi:hypothetical protein XELAEV_18041896mg [Xenopus laevis]|uniref:Uncharacterized protein n=1 Tax=Xenopus laevis TaxID=8355 RepID=A0A974C2Z6_XENLA|nr:hypothetical protein XELAEV_18041896mg [Xenopus laevis]
MILADLASFLACRSSSMAWIVAIREWKLTEWASGRATISLSLSLGTNPARNLAFNIRWMGDTGWVFSGASGPGSNPASVTPCFNLCQ